MAKKPAPEKEIVTLSRLEVQYVPIDAVHPNDYNPNRQDDDEFQLLLKSIQEDGFTQPVVCRPDDTPLDGFDRTWTIVDGFHRWKAGKTLGYTECPIVETNMTEVQARIATLRHNRARGQEDVQLLSELMRDFEKLGAMDWAADSLEMSDEEIDRLLSYGGSVVDAFANEEPSRSWEPRPTLPGQVQSWSDPDTNEKQAVSSAAATPIAGAGYSPTPDVPGLGKAAEYIKNTPGAILRDAPAPPSGGSERAPLMARRIFVMLEEQARVIDAALGANPVDTLLEMCRARLDAQSS